MPGGIVQRPATRLLSVSEPGQQPPDGTYFEPLDERPDGGRYLADPGTAGPWSDGLQHGGPPSALLVRAAERAGDEATPPDTNFVAMRAAVEFVGPVPVGEVAVSTRVVRAARSAVLVAATLVAGDRVCLESRVWLVRAAATPLPEPVAVPRDLPDLGADFPYHDTIEWQAVRGSMITIGPGLVWARPRRSLVAGETLSGLQGVVLVGDSSSGISAELDWDEWSFLNVDLDVHLSRPVHGEWVLIDAVTSVGTAGAALARSTVSDVRGPVGTTAQTLVLGRR
jgi:hypothetical protein